MGGKKCHLSIKLTLSQTPNLGEVQVVAVPVRTAFIWKHHKDVYHLGTSAAQIITKTHLTFFERNSFFAFPKQTNFAYSSSSTDSSCFKHTHSLISLFSFGSSHLVSSQSVTSWRHLGVAFHCWSTPPCSWKWAFFFSSRNKQTNNFCRLTEIEWVSPNCPHFGW